MNTIDKIGKLLENKGIPPHKRVSTLVKITGKSPQAINKWFKGGTNKPDYENVKAISKAYNVSFDELWNDKQSLSHDTSKAESRSKLNKLMEECLELGIDDILISQTENLLKVAQSKK